MKICAGGLQYRTADLIPFSLDALVEKNIQAINFSYRSKKIRKRRYHQTIMYTVERSGFDHFLALQAEQAGCDYRYGYRVMDFDIAEKKITVSTTEGCFEAKILVGADGINGAVHKKLLLGRPLYKILGYHYECRAVGWDKKFEADDHIALDIGGVNRGYAWIFPRKKGVSIGIGAPLAEAKKMKHYFNFFLKKYALLPQTDDPFKIFAQCIPVRGADTPLCSHRLLSVGDAAGLGDAFTGEGLYNGLFSAFLASECIQKALKKNHFTFDDYHRKVYDQIYGEIKISMAVSKIFFQFPLLMYNILIKNDKIFETCCRFLRGETNYRRLAKKLKFLNY